MSFLNGPTGTAAWSTPGRPSTNPESFATENALYVAWEEYWAPFNQLVVQKVE